MPATQRVLVVDDDDDIRTLVCLVLESEGYQAIPARDGLEALEALHEPQLPSLILLDIMMPRMDGEELVRALRASPQLSSIPVVILSGHNNAREKSRSSCVRGCLVKPVDVDILLRAVREFRSARA